MTDLTKNELELQEALVELRKRKLKKKAITIAIIAAVVLAIFTAVWLLGHSYAKNKSQNEIEDLKKQIQELIDTPLVVEPVTPEIVQSILSKQITEIAELATAEYLFTNAAKFTSSASNSWLPSWVTEKSFIQKWDGSIKAGIDLSNIDINVAEKTITISLSQAEILSYEVNYDSVEILDEKNNVFNPISIEDKAKFDAETAESMKARAIENGLLEKAQKNAENIINNILKSSLENIQDYTINFVIKDA